MKVVYTYQVFFCAQSRMQMSENVNNDVSMNPPYQKRLSEIWR